MVTAVKGVLKHEHVLESTGQASNTTEHLCHTVPQTTRGGAETHVLGLPTPGCWKGLLGPPPSRCEDGNHGAGP